MKNKLKTWIRKHLKVFLISVKCQSEAKKTDNVDWFKQNFEYIWKTSRIYETRFFSFGMDQKSTYCNAMHVINEMI